MTRTPKPRGRPSHDLPTPEQLDETPALALLALLDVHLELVVRLLVAAHPALVDPERPLWRRDTSPSYRAADVLVARIRPLLRAVAAYRRAVTPRPKDPGPDDVAL